MSADRARSQATRHSAIVVASFVAMLGLNYAFGVALSWFLTPAEFGVLGVGQSILLLLALVLGNGFAWTAAHDLAAGGLTAGTRQRFRAAWAANLVLGLLLAGAVWLLSVPVLGPAYRPVIPLVAVTAVLLAARSVINGAARGLYRFGAVAVNQGGEVIVKAGMGLALILAGAGVAGALAGFALGAGLSLVHSLWITRDARLWQGRGWLDRKVVTATGPLFISMLGVALMLNLDVLGLKLLAPGGRGDELAGYYQAAVILARAPVFVAQALVLVLFSYAAGERAPAGADAGPAHYGHDAIRAWVRLILPIGLALALAPEAALGIFFPETFGQAAGALRVAALGGLLLALVTLLTGILQAGGDRRRPALAAAGGAAAQALMLVLLVPAWGAVGAAWSLAGAGLAALAGLAPLLLARREALLPVEKGKAGQALIRVVLPAVALALPLLLIPGTGRVLSLLKFGLAGGGYLALLVVTRPWPAASMASGRSVMQHLNQFMHLLMGG